MRSPPQSKIGILLSRRLSRPLARPPARPPRPHCSFCAETAPDILTAINGNKEAFLALMREDIVEDGGDDEDDDGGMDEDGDGGGSAFHSSRHAPSDAAPNPLTPVSPDFSVQWAA